MQKLEQKPLSAIIGGVIFGPFLFIYAVLFFVVLAFLFALITSFQLWIPKLVAGFAAAGELAVVRPGISREPRSRHSLSPRQRKVVRGTILTGETRADLVSNNAKSSWPGCPGHPRLAALETKTWMRGSSPRKTT